MSFESHTENFKEWINENFSFVSDKFEIKDLRNINQGRGLIAVEDIKAGESLFELSRDAIFNVETASILNLNDNVHDVLLSLTQWQALIICLAYEWYLNENSKLLPYLNVLPLKSDDYNTLMYWNDEELQYLKPSGVLSRIGRNSAEEMYSILVADIIPNQIKSNELAEFLTLEKFHIIASLILSYSFDVEHPEEVENDDEDVEGEEEIEREDGEEEHVEGEEHENEEEDEEHIYEHEEGNSDGEDEDEDGSDDEAEQEDPVSQDSYFKSMVPLADTLNSDTTKCNAKLKYEKTKLVMVAEKDIKKGEQIFNIYGELPNSEILRKYGYVELPSSKYEFAEIQTPTIKEYFQDLFEKQFKFLDPNQSNTLVDTIFELIETSEYLDENLSDDMDIGILSEKYEIYNDGEVVPEFLLLILIITSIYQSVQSDEKWFKKIVKSIERKPSTELVSFIHRTILKSHQLLEEKLLLTKSTVETIKELIKIRIHQYPTYITDGTYKLPESYNLSDKKEMANIVLFNEVQCLKSVIDDKFPPINKEDGLPRFKVIDDDKFLKNLLKRKVEETASKSKSKRQKK
ncbi:ribosomal lysine N-methyltransferase [Pichia kluyveri]|uniref:Ribosomal lysine N-methyltransferase n=1 Tax=Pichia kluyveri TaxID=36015 RepID=A0AAV5R963_PICKL|nr:ribosomal lysine N-methyltransferase [Pichia kluyveri]